MNFPTLVLTCSLALASTGFDAFAQTDEFTPRSMFEQTANFAADPVPQIQAHLASVIDRLETADVSSLKPDVLERRRQQIAVLADYAAVGVFPINPGLPTPSPIFIDGGGRACAVGHLMIESGAADLAQRICAASNFAYVPDIAVSGAIEWMESVGLSAEECAWIQPAYGCPGGDVTVGVRTCTPTVPNSAGLTAIQTPCGTNNVADNNVLLLVDGLPEGSVGYFLNAQSADAMVQPGTSQGTLCLSGAIGRHDAQVFSAIHPLSSPFTTGNWWSGIVLDQTQMPTPAGLVAVVPGDTWFFQAWYRDVNPMPTSNLSDVISITFS
jgi:hypothetical protein